MPESIGSLFSLINELRMQKCVKIQNKTGFALALSLNVKDLLPRSRLKANKAARCLDFGLNFAYSKR